MRTILNPDYYAYGVMNDVNPPIGTVRASRWRRPSRGAAASANSPDNIPFPGFLNMNRTNDVSISLTKVAGRHTIKTGFYNTHSYKAQQRGGWNGTIASPTTRTTRSTRRFHLPMPRSASSGPTRRRPSTSKGSSSTTTPRATCRTTGR